MTPKNTLLEGTNKESYWCATLTEEREKSENCPLEDLLADWTAKLGAFRTELDKLLIKGGSIEYFIWIFCDRNLGFEFSHKLLADIASLGIKLGIVCDP